MFTRLSASIICENQELHTVNQCYLQFYQISKVRRCQYEQMLQKLQHGMSLSPMPSIAHLQPQQTQTAVVGIDFADTTQKAVFEILTDESCIKATLGAPVGEQLEPVMIDEDGFKKLHR